MSQNRRVIYSLHDAEDKPVGSDLFPFPSSSVPGGSSPDGGRGERLPFTVSDLCTLPPADLVRMAPPHLQGFDSCGAHAQSSSQASFREKCRSHGGTDAALDPKCLWDMLTEPNNALRNEPGLFCLPLDHPLLASRQLAPLPNVTESDRTPWFTGSQTGSALKHQLQLRNHSMANFPVFANVTVSPGHKRLRLGVCVSVPPTNTPCSLSTVDPGTGTIAADWLLQRPLQTSGRNDPIDLALARPLSAFSTMSGPNLNNLDSISSALAPLPFVVFQATSPAQSLAWAIPLARCAATNATVNDSAVGVIRPLVVEGTCASGRDCLSGACHSDNKTCDNSIKPETKSPFSNAFVIDRSRPLTFPTNKTLREITAKWKEYNSFSPDMLSSDAVTYLPLIVASGIVFGILLVTAIWTESGRRLVRNWTSGRWRTTTERDMELKPVSGRMVADLGDERAVQEAAEAAQEQLPVYVDVDQRQGSE